MTGEKFEFAETSPPRKSLDYLTITQCTFQLHLILKHDHFPPNFYAVKACVKGKFYHVAQMIHFKSEIPPVIAHHEQKIKKKTKSQININIITKCSSPPLPFKASILSGFPLYSFVTFLILKRKKILQDMTVFFSL